MFSSWIGITLIFFIFIAINIPLGRWRKGVKKFSFLWFVIIHATVPFEIGLRIFLDLPKYCIPLFIVAIVIGQYLGARTARH